MKKYILLLLQVFSSGFIIAQNSSVRIDSICLPNLALEDEAIYNYIEKELLKNKIYNDTLFLYLDNIYKKNKDETYKNKLSLRIKGGENYLWNIKVSTNEGYFYVNNVCIIVRRIELEENIKLFKYKNNDCKYFSYSHKPDFMPAYCIGSDISLNYYIKIRSDNKIKIWRRHK